MNIQAKILECPDTAEGMDKLVSQWNKLNLSSVYLLADHLSSSIVEEALKEFHGELWIIIQTLLAPEENHFPLAVTAQGKSAVGEGNGSWLKMLCPSGINDHGVSVVQWRIQQIEQLIRIYKPTGISLDFIRHFVFWEEIYKDSDAASIPRTCFCETCIRAFSEFSNVNLPSTITSAESRAKWILENYLNEWNEFTADSIFQLAEEIVSCVKKMNSSIKINIHLVPWMKNEFKGTRDTHVGQNLTRLSPIIDRISPMCYTSMLKRPFSWIPDLVNDISKESDLPVYPAVQICPMYGTAELSESEFERLIWEAQKRPSAGVILWPWERLTEKQLKQLKSFNF